MSADAWGGDLPDVQVREVQGDTPAGYSDERGREAWQEVVHHAGTLVETERLLSRALLHGAEWQVQNLGGTHLVGLCALLQDLRRSLAQTEGLLAMRAGRDEATPRDGVLPDGRHYEVRRGTTRKAWDHDGWKHDVRAQVLSGVGEVVDTSTGEQVDVHALVAAVQEVHGSSAPRVTALKRLGLEPDTYCESVPGTWGVRVQGDTGED